MINNINKKKYLSSEEYRQMLVKDGERRFQEWHNSFINYQKKFLQEQQFKRSALSN